MLTAETFELERQAWHRIWGIRGPERLNFFLWRLRHNTLPTAAFLRKRHLVHYMECPLCGQYSCGDMHEVRDCSWARRVWKLLLNCDWIHAFFGCLSMTEWVDFNLAHNCGRRGHNARWDYLFREAAYSIWSCRNEVLHGRRTECMPPGVFIKEILKRVSLTLVANGIFGCE